MTSDYDAAYINKKFMDLKPTLLHPTPPHLLSAWKAAPSADASSTKRKADSDTVVDRVDDPIPFSVEWYLDRTRKRSIDEIAMHIRVKQCTPHHPNMLQALGIIYNEKKTEIDAVPLFEKRIVQTSDPASTEIGPEGQTRDSHDMIEEMVESGEGGGRMHKLVSWVDKRQRSL